MSRKKEHHNALDKNVKKVCEEGLEHILNKVPCHEYVPPKHLSEAFSHLFQDNKNLFKDECPTEEELLFFILSYPQRVSHPISAHLNHCSQCREAVEILTQIEQEIEVWPKLLHDLQNHMPEIIADNKLSRNWVLRTPLKPAQTVVRSDQIPTRLQMYKFQLAGSNQLLLNIRNDHVEPSTFQLYGKVLMVEDVYLADLNGCPVLLSVRGTGRSVPLTISDRSDFSLGALHSGNYSLYIKDQHNLYECPFSISNHAA